MGNFNSWLMSDTSQECQLSNVSQDTESNHSLSSCQPSATLIKEVITIGT